VGFFVANCLYLESIGCHSSGSISPFIGLNLSWASASSPLEKTA
jgi:hypothetical protein